MALKKIKIIYWALVGVFVYALFGHQLMWQMFLPLLIGNFGPIFFLLPYLALFFLGLGLIFLTLRSKIKGRLKKFLLLTGASPVAMFICVILHNLVYGLMVLTFGMEKLEEMGFVDEAFFFIIAVFVCPLAFLVGAVGSGILLWRKR